MRIRSTKPEFWRSERIASVSWEARLVLKALESYVDDNGVGKDDLVLIATDTFPRDLIQEPSRVLKQLQVAFDALSEAGLLWRYEVDGAKYIFISFWEQVQYINRPTKGRYPRPDGTLNYGDSDIRSSIQEPSSNVLESSNLNRGTGNRGTGEQKPVDPGATRADVNDVLGYFDAHLKKLDLKTVPRTKKQYQQMRLLIDTDKRDVELIKKVLDEIFKGWWKGKILDADKLRDKFDTIYGQMDDSAQQSQSYAPQLPLASELDD